MYRDSYRDDYERELDARPLAGYGRDPYYEERGRERKYDLDERDRPASRYTTPPYPPVLSEDPYYRRMDDLDGRALPRGGREPPPSHAGHEEVGDAYKSVVIYMLSPFVKPKRTPHDKPINCDTVFVGSLPASASDKHLYDLFERCGKINDVRVSRGRGFGHVQFADKEAVDTAILLNGAHVLLTNERSKSDWAQLHVDFAAARGEPDFQRRVQTEEYLTYSTSNAQTISSDLHREESFHYAAKNIIQWLEKGCCNSSTASSFFGLISLVNTHCRKLSKDVNARQEEITKVVAKRNEFLEKVRSECECSVSRGYLNLQ